MIGCELNIGVHQALLLNLPFSLVGITRTLTQHSHFNMGLSIDCVPDHTLKNYQTLIFFRKMNFNEPKRIFKNGLQILFLQFVFLSTKV